MVMAMRKKTSGDAAFTSSLSETGGLAVSALVTVTRLGLYQQYNNTHNGRQRCSLFRLNIPAMHSSYIEFFHSSVHLPLTPSHPPLNNLINTLHSLLTALNLKPLPMFPTTSRTISHDPLFRQLQMDQPLHSLHTRDLAYHARRLPTRCSRPRCILTRLTFGRADWTAGCRTWRSG